MIKPIFKLEQKLIRLGYDFVIGIDEAGRGPLAGPVVACAASLICPSDTFSLREKGILKNINLIRDSKTLSEKQRESLYDFILENFYVGIGICDHKTIDRINILQATFLAMKKALTSLARGISNSPNYLISNKNHNAQIPMPNKAQKSKFIILVDGNKQIPNCSYEQKAIIGGDKKIKTISAASIIAKVTRDRIMRQMHKIYPNYRFDKHKGYGTRQHYKMLGKFGPCKIHRKSFNLMLDT